MHADCFEWLQRVPEESLPAVVTDPPYGVKEYELDQIQKTLANRDEGQRLLAEVRHGGLRRSLDGGPLRERQIANHPSLKPQSLLRLLVYSALPLGEGVIADPFMGSGSTVAAAEAMGLHCVGVERHAEYFETGADVIPRLAALGVALPAPAMLSAPPLWE